MPLPKGGRIPFNWKPPRGTPASANQARRPQPAEQVGDPGGADLPRRHRGAVAQRDGLDLGSEPVNWTGRTEEGCTFRRRSIISDSV